MTRRRSAPDAPEQLSFLAGGVPSPTPPEPSPPEPMPPPHVDLGAATTAPIEAPRPVEVAIPEAPPTELTPEVVPAQVPAPRTPRRQRTPSTATLPRLPGPLLKYPGGKSKLAGAIVDRIFAEGTPDAYAEPFLGAGSVLFEVLARGFTGDVVLADVEVPIRSLFTQLQNPEALLRALMALPAADISADDYFTVRAHLDDRAQTPEEEATQAARLLWLNRVGYNGLYRRSKNGYTVDYGKVTEVNLSSIVERVEAANLLLRRVNSITVYSEAGQALLAEPLWARRGLVYCDPPYIGGFVDYNEVKFKLASHILLADILRAHRARGFVSHTATPEALKVYRPREVHAVGAVRRSISRRGDRRDAVAESLFVI